MEPRQEFRNLVTNQYMKNFDYAKTFSFQTVFYQTAYSYCCCSCGFEHEYLDYISETGVINEDKYEKIVKSIIDGSCPHTAEVQKEWLNKTRVSALHIAIAVGTEKAQKKYLDELSIAIKRSGIFKLSLFDTALMKNNYHHANYFYKCLAFPSKEDIKIPVTETLFLI